MSIEAKRPSLRAGGIVALLATVLAPLLIAPQDATSQESPPFSLSLEQVADGFDQPTYVTDVDDGSGRLFVLEQGGVIRIIDGSGEVLPEPFLDISQRVESDGLERGLLGLEFHPRFEENGYFYVTYTPTASDCKLVRYQVSDDPNLADPDSETVLLELPPEGGSHYGGHYGGMLTLGPDGYLYVSVGDSGGEYDPLEVAQDTGSLFGSILRLDIASDDRYAIPPDNPFVGDPDARPEIWAYGLRNPWRFSFDRETGDLYIADVGHVDWEEINIEPVGSQGGINYGWPIMEGPECSPAAPDCDSSGFQPPVAAYTHEDGCSVTGGYVYRGDQSSPMYGHYFYSDYCSGTIWTLEQDQNGEWEPVTLLESGMNVSSFGQDQEGELYLTDVAGGGVYHLTATAAGSGPEIERVEPAVIPAGGVACRIDVFGSGFDEGTTVLWNGEERPTTYHDDSHLTAALSSDDVSMAGTATVSVGNTGDDEESSAVPLEITGGAIGGQAVSEIWSRADGPVADGTASRAWLWGPDGLTCAMPEDYQDAPDGSRAVQYFNKGRMEVTHPDADPDSTWYVTSGLLVVEMITGRLQLGDDAFEQRSPADTAVAGDLGDPQAPTYATFDGLTAPVEQRTGETIIERIDRAGNVDQDTSLGQHGITTAHYDAVTGHSIAGPFWAFMQSGDPAADGEPVTRLFESPLYATGRPVTEAYWSSVEVDGTSRQVLMQCFERRCLTFTPSNEPGWRVESGNVGLHYYFWRYGSRPS